MNNEEEKKPTGLGLGEFKIPLTLYKKNRDKLFDRFAKRVGTEQKAAVVVQGGDEQYRYDTDHEILFRQESNFLYLFGINEPGCYGALDLIARESILFIPRYGLDYEVWCGKVKPLAWYRETYGVDHVFFSDEVASVLKERGIETIHTMYGKNTDSGNYSKEAEFKDRDQFKVDNSALHYEITECRVIKSEEELEVLRYITALSSRAHKEVMRTVKPGMMEYQLESIFRHYTQMKGGSRYLAYTCICGSGSHGATLHYGHAGAPNSKKIEEKDMLLLDMGAEYHGYCADITCSYPASGTFSEDQKIVYEAVREAQDAVLDALKPNVLWSDMHRLAERVILDHLVKAGLVLLEGKTLDDLLKLHIGAIFMPHGLGHFIGLDTHDVGGYNDCERIDEPGVRCLRTNRVLQENMCLTVEPGCYFIEALLDRGLADPKVAPHLNAEKLKRFRNFGGVRLEDDIIITADGCENMTQCPRTIAEIEALMKERTD